MNKENFANFTQNKNVVMFVTAIFFMSGILAYFNNCAIVLSVITTTVLIFFSIKNLISWKYLLLWGIIFYIGFFNANFRVSNTDELAKIAPCDATIVGKIITIPTGNTKDKMSFFIETNDVNGEKIKAKAIVNLTSENNDFSSLNIGNNYKITGKLRLPFKASNPSQFDYSKYLKNFKAHTILYAEYTDCEKIDSTLGIKWRFLQKLNNIRTEIINTHSLYLKSPNLEILGGVVFGDDAVAPPDYVKDTFKNSGLLHILAASGMNVAFIYGFWYFILSRLRINTKFTIISGMLVVILYTLMTGLGASVVRAALMLLFVLAGKLIDRDSHSVSLLSFVATLMLIYNPSYINDIGFQLSFIVTFGLLTTANAVMVILQKTKIPNWLCAEILIPIVSQLWVAPLQMFYFNTISTYSILANIAIMPFISIISFGGFVSSLLAIIKPISIYICRILDYILNFCLTILLNISNYFSDLPHSLIETTHPIVIQILIYYTILLLITLMLRFGLKNKLVISSLILTICLFITTITIQNNDTEVISFDVQNADAFLIKSPANKYFVIDTGKAPYNNGKSQAEVIILKYMKDKGIKEIEGLIITHFDNDHSGGAYDIINKIKVNSVYINSLNNTSLTSKNIYKILKEKNIHAIIPNNNQIIYSEEPDFSLTAYMPQGKTDNDQSIITLLSNKDFQMLFTGDAGVDAFDNISKYIPNEKIEILKVGHHGASGTVNNSMIEKLNPDISIISTGKNIFGHPHKATLDSLRKTDIYRTDINNSIKIVYNTNSYKVYTYNINSKKYKLFKSYLPKKTS